MKMAVTRTLSRLNSLFRCLPMHNCGVSPPDFRYRLFRSAKAAS